MSVVVTGANGFIGSHLVAELARQRHRVVALVRKDSHIRWLEGLPIVIRRVDLRRPESFSEAIGDCRLLFHIAGLTTAIKATDYQIANVETTRRLLECCSRQSPHLQRFVYLSSLAAIGPSTKERPVSESDPPRPLTAYGKSKYSAECVLAEFSDRLPLTVIRPPPVFGPGDLAFLKIFQWAQRRAKFKLGSREKLLSLIYVKDLVDFLILAANHRQPNMHSFMISDGNIYTWNDFFDAITRTSGVKGVEIRLPQWLVTLALAGSHAFAKISGKPTLYNLEKAAELRMDCWTLDPSKAFNELGFRPRYSLDQGLRETLDWYRHHGWC